MHRPWTLRVPTWVQRYLFKLLRFPCYDYELLISQLEELRGESIPESDIKAYMESSTKVKYRRFQWIFAITILLLITKNLYFPYITVTMINYEDFWSTVQRNTSVQDDGYGPYYFLICLYSNCTQFTQREDSEVKDMRHFPVLPICFPKLNRFYPPTTWLAPYALILHALLAAALFFTSLLLPAYTNSYPTTCDALMFLAAPDLTRRIMCTEIHKIYKNLKISYENFKLVMVQLRNDKRYKQSLFLSSRIPHYGSYYCSDYNDRFNKFQSPGHAELQVAGADVNRCNGYEVDCLPRIRAYSWLTKGSLQFCYVGLMFVAVSGCISIVIIYDLSQRCAQKAAEHVIIRDVIVSSGCKHFQLDSDGSRHYLPPDAWLFDFEYLALIDNLFICSIVFIQGGILSAYMLVIVELNDFRTELEHQCKILSFATYLILYELGKADTVNLSTDKSVYILMDTIEAHIKDIKNTTVKPTRDYLINERSRILQRFIHTPEELDLARARRQRAYSMAPNDDSQLHTLLQIAHDKTDAQGLARYIALMEKFYISFRLFYNYVKKCSGTTLPLAFISHIQSFGLIATILWHSHTVKKFTFEHLLLTAINCAFSMTVVVIMSNFHAKAKRIERSLWNLNALMSGSRDRRIEHLRFLWTRQLQTVSNEGGVALKQFNLRVTYVNALQVIVWTATMIALSVRDE